MRTRAPSTTFGGHSGGGTPLPIPNREVKPASADGTRGASPRESRSPPNSLKAPTGAFAVRGHPLVHAARSLSRQSGSRLAAGWTRSSTGGWVTNRLATPSSSERVDRVERLGRGLARNSTSSPACSRRISASASAVRRAAHARGDPVRLELALRREKQVDERRPRSGRARTGARARASRRTGSSRRAARQRRPRRVCTIMSRLPDVRELVSEHRLDLGGRRRRRAGADSVTAIAERAPSAGGERERGAVSITYSAAWRSRRGARAARPSRGRPAPRPSSSSRAPTIPSTTRSATSSGGRDEQPEKTKQRDDAGVAERRSRSAPRTATQAGQRAATP